MPLSNGGRHSERPTPSFARLELRGLVMGGALPGLCPLPRRDKNVACHFEVEASCGLMSHSMATHHFNIEILSPCPPAGPFILSILPSCFRPVAPVVGYVLTD